MGINKMRWEQDLIKDIRTHSEYDNQDNNFDQLITRDTPYGNDWQEFSSCNHDALMEYFFKIKDSCRAILEIGVCRNNKLSSTYSFLNNKKDETIYAGIDLDNKSFLDNHSKNIFTIAGNSSNVDENIERLKSFGVTELDFILIDGWHSINQVLTDWEYTKILSPNGIVAFHDVMEHPGPYHFVRNLNTDIWNVDIRCPSDWGIAFAWRK
jgi:mRNA-degrading endonuclease HigB of HigAB toxin-antitoxin module